MQILLHYRLLHFLQNFVYAVCLQISIFILWNTWNYYDGWGCVACYHSLAKEDNNIAQTTGTYWCTRVDVCMYSGFQSNFADRCSAEWAVQIKCNMGICCTKKLRFISEEVHLHMQEKDSLCHLFGIVDKLCFRRRPRCHFSCIIHYFTQAYTAFLCISTGKELHPKFLHTPQYINESGKCWWFLFAARKPWVSAVDENCAYLRHTPMPCV